MPMQKYILFSAAAALCVYPVAVNASAAPCISGPASAALGQSRAAPPPAEQKGPAKLTPPSALPNLPAPALQGLQKRIDLTLGSTLPDIAGRIYSLAEVAISSNTPAVHEKPLTPAHYKGYRPTVEELIDQLQRQTKSTATYLPERRIWMLGPPAAPLPIGLTLPDGWTSTDKGSYIACKPPVAPFALDIYILGKYSPQAGENIEDILQKAREQAAMTFVARINAQVKLTDMKEETIAGMKMLTCETIAPTGMKWRQWVFTAANRCYVAASAIRPEQESTLLPHVQQMLKSFVINE